LFDVVFLFSNLNGLHLTQTVGFDCTGKIAIGLCKEFLAKTKVTLIGVCFDFDKSGYKP